MDSIPIQFQHLKKPKGILNFQAIRSLTNLFRLLELLLLLILISKLSFPSLKLISGDIFKEAVVFLVSPRFVFFIGNIIVITLFAKSGRCSLSQEPSKTTTEAVSKDLYQEFLHKSEKKSRVSFERSQTQKAFEAVQPLKRYDESEKHLRICDSDKKVKKAEDRMSNEQFKTKIEAFIARQKRIQKDEEYLMMI